MSLLERMTVTVPEGEVDGVRVERFEVVPSVTSMRMAMRGRGTPPGWYTKLVEGNTLWMSDTSAEKRDHITAVRQMDHLKAQRVMINGLGLGMVLQAALSFDHVEHVDVVERDERIIRLVGPHYTKDPRVEIHHADAYEQTKKWPSGTKWDVGWSDIWPDICADNLPGMAKLNRSYGRRCTWHGCWQQGELKYLAERERKEDRMRAGFFS